MTEKIKYMIHTYELCKSNPHKRSTQNLNLHTTSLPLKHKKPKSQTKQNPPQKVKINHLPLFRSLRRSPSPGATPSPQPSPSRAQYWNGGGGGGTRRQRRTSERRRRRSSSQRPPLPGSPLLGSRPCPAASPPRRPRVGWSSQNAQHQDLLGVVPSRPGAEGRGSPGHRSGEGRHQEVLQSGDLVRSRASSWCCGAVWLLWI